MEHVGLHTLSGIVTTREPIGGPDGNLFKHFWCKNWRVSQIVMNGVAPHNTWIFCGFVDSILKIMIPGNQIIGWLACESRPAAAKTMNNYCVIQ